MSGDLFEGVGAHEYDGVWKAWKLGSLGLFAVFVGTLIHCAKSLHRIERKLSR